MPDLESRNQQLLCQQKREGCSFCKKKDKKRHKEGFSYPLFEVLLENPFSKKNHGEDHSVLHCAAKDENFEVVRQFISTCALDAKDGHGYTALHYAAKSGNFSILRLLILNGADINALDSSESTALHILVKQKWKPSVKKCTEYLLRQIGVAINARDFFGATPIDWAIYNENKEAVNALIEKGPIDVDASFMFPGNEETVREILAKIFPDIQSVLPSTSESITETTRIRIDKLYRLLRNSDYEDRFCTSLEGDMKSPLKNEILSSFNGEHTFLQRACELNFIRAVNLLLKNGADINQAPFYTLPPIFIACLAGHHEILEILISNKELNIHPEMLDGRSPLHWVAMKCVDSSNHMRCLDILLERAKGSKLHINRKDIFGNTALHYAVNYSADYPIVNLLKNGAYLGINNNKGKSPLFAMPCRALKEFLDSTIQGEGVKPDNVIIFDYSFLNPPFSYTSDDRLKFDKKGKLNGRSIVPETEPLLVMSQIKELQPLLTHPILTSFTSLKWQRIQMFYFCHLFSYIALCISLSCYILLCQTRHLEMVGLSAEPKELKHNDILALECTLNVAILRKFISCFIVFLSVKCLIQFSFKPVTYILDIENLLDMFVLSTSAVILIIDRSSVMSGGVGLVRTQLCAIAILLSYFKVVVLMGQHPRFSVQVDMFLTVASRFFKFLTCYFILLLAFAFAFYVLFRDCSRVCPDTNPFTDPGTAIFRTIVMLTGEFDTGNIPFITFIGTSHTIFVAFVFLIAVVLLNLLNGLAVADTQMILDKSYLHSCKARVKLIVLVEEFLRYTTAKYERMNMNNFKLAQFLDLTLLCAYLLLKIRDLIRFFPTLISTDCIVTYPNYNNRIEFDTEPRNKRGLGVGEKCNNTNRSHHRSFQKKKQFPYYIEDSTMKDAIELIDKKKCESEEFGKSNVLATKYSCSSFQRKDLEK